MANFHLNVTVASRGGGSASAVGSGSYQHNTKMAAEYDGRGFDYSNKNDLVHAELAVPSDAPEWVTEAYGEGVLSEFIEAEGSRNAAFAKMSEKLWNDVEHFEAVNNRRHKTAQLARKMRMSLPNGLSRAEHIELGRAYFQKNFTDRGMIVDWVIHHPDAVEGKVDNPHMHALVTFRNIGEDGWGLKNPSWNERGMLASWRFEWANEVNMALERAGLDERVDHRSYVDQGIDLKPTSYNPFVAEAVESRGEVARNRDRAMAAKESNKAYLLENPEHILRVVQAERSVFGEGDVRAAFEKRMGVGVDLDALTAAAMGSRDIVLVAHLQGDDGDAQYMTKAQASVETNLMVDALELNAGRLAIDEVTDLRNVGAGLGEEQVAALVEMVSDRRLSLVTGYAGAGKTRTIGAAAQVWRERGFEVLGGAVAGKATQELMNIEGMTAASLAAWEARWSWGQTPREGRFVFFMDEAGMVGSSHWERVQKRILDMGGKLIAVGDPEQLQPVHDTAPFVALQDQVGVKVIGVVRRMENPLDREATRMFAQGERWAQQALDYYTGAGCVQSVSGEGEAFERVVGEYFEKGGAGESRVAAFYTNRDANLGNDLLHARAVELGRVPEASLVDYGLIRRVDRRGLHPKIETAPMIFGAGERIRFTRPHRELNIPKSSFATVLEARVGEMDLFIDGDASRRVTIDLSRFDHFDYGYGATTHALQGMTVDHVMALAHPRMTRHVSYVMMSRHAKSVEMIVPESRFRKVDFEDVATRSGYLNADIEARSERHVVRGQTSLQGLGRSDGGEVALRMDYVADPRVSEDGVVLEDAHVSSVFRHYHGLLNAEYIEGEVAAVGDDPHGFVEQPQGVIDHLVAQHSTLVASDVADALAKVVADPETFARLFYEALEHPDLVVLREEGADGARVYSTTEQVTQELRGMDKGVALAVGSQDPRLEVGAGYVGAALAQGAFDVRVAEAVQYAGQGGQVRLISGGSGSGKTQALGAVAQAHEWAGFDVVAIAPTRRTAAQFGMQAGVSSSSFGSLVYGLERGARHLDENSVIVLDHGDLMGLDDADRLLELVAQSGAKLVAGYGQNGLSSISAGNVFGDLAARIETYELGGSLRLDSGFGRDVFEAVTSDAVATSTRGDVFAEMVARDALVAGGSHDASIEALADAYIADPSSDKVILAQSNKDVVLLNEAIATRLRDARAQSDVGHGGGVERNGDQVEDFNAEVSDASLGYDLKALGVGDKVVLTEYYIPGQLQAGEQGVVIEATEQSITLRLGRVQDERYITVERNDAEFSVGLNFAQTIYTAQGQGRSSVHVLGTKGLSREGLSTAVGLHEDALRIVVPAQEATEAIDIVQAIATRDRQDLTVASYVTDHTQACAQVHAQATAYFEAERGANNPYAAPSFEALSEDRQATAEYLRKNPGHVLTLLGAERSVFSEREIEAALVSRLGGKASDLSGVFDSVMAHPSLVVLDRFGPGGHRLHTTRAHVVRETNLIAEARTAMAVPLDLGVDAENFALAPHLGAGQNKAVRAMLNEERISLVIGYAGTGKTTIVSEAARVWKDRGYEVLGGALSGRATQELSGVDGMEVASLAAWEAKWARGTRPKEGKFVFVMDEAGMVGSDVWARVQSRVLALGGKLVAVGDPEQLQPISDSNVFKALETEFGARIIEDVLRQNNPSDREYTRQLAHGGREAVEAIRGYAERGAVVFKDSEADAIGAIAKEYFKAGSQGQSRRAYAATNADVVALNDSVRAEALRRGVVDPSTVVNYGLIQRINRSGGMERVETAALTLGVGDHVVFTEAHRDLRIPKSSFARVTATRPSEVDLVIEGGDGRAVTLDMAVFNKLDYGFAATIHKGQGGSKDISFLLGHSIMDRHSHYVGLSRHRDGVHFYVPRTRVPNMGALERLVQRNAYQSLAASEIDGAILESSGISFDSINIGAGDRLDRRADRDGAIHVGFESDAHLNSVVNRMTGLLRANYVAGDPVLGDDPRGYAQNPRQIIDDLIKQQSTIRATEVSRVLSGVARAPDTFARLFVEAMSHPDLVVLSEEGQSGEGRVYSTKAQVALELDVMDRAVRLAMLNERNKGAEISATSLRHAVRGYGLSSEQETVLKQAGAGRLNIVSGGSGSGKSRLAAAIGDVHRQDGWSVVRVAPTGVGVDNLRDEGGATAVMTVAALEYSLAQDNGIRLTEKSVVVLDEAGQVGAKTADRLLRAVEESGAKLIALRDNDQLGPYEAAPIFQALEARIGGVELVGEHRCHNTLTAPILEGLKAEELVPRDAANALIDANVIHAGGTRLASIEKLAADFVTDPSSDKIALAHSRADVAALNVEIRKQLDQKFPERISSENEQEHPTVGSLADLRVGDRIVLASHYKVENQRYRAGTVFDVERRVGRDGGEVVLRTGDGETARYLKLNGDHDDFEYRMGFATTVHGSKGRGRDSVHMLATPGMSKNVFYTGAALHKHALNVVLPASETTLGQATGAILQTPDTAQSVFDYGFEALEHAREAVRSQENKPLHEPNKLVDGFDRFVDWVADRIDGGSDKLDLPSRAGRLRALVVAELIAARREMGDGKHRFSAADRLKVERNVDQLINRRAWGRLVGASGSQPSEGTELGRFGKDATAQDRMVARILERGVIAATKSKDEGLRDWFEAASKALEMRVEKSVEHTKEVAVKEAKVHADIRKWRARQKGKTEVEKKPAQTLSHQINKEDQKDMDYVPKLLKSETIETRPVASDKTVENTHLARALTSAISRHVDYDDPVHERDDLYRDVLTLVENGREAPISDAQKIEKMACSISLKRQVVEAKLKLIQDVIERDPQKDSIVNKARAVYQNTNPFASLSPNNATIYDKMLPSRLESAKELTPSFSEYEVAKLASYAREKEPDLLPIAKAAMDALGFEKVEGMEGRNQHEMRAEIIRALAVDRNDKSLETKEQKQGLLDRVYTAFTRNEIASLINPDMELARSLPNTAVDRSKVHDTLKQLNNVHRSKTALRHTSGALSKLNTPVQSLGIGFEM